MTDRNTICALSQVLKDGFRLEDLHELCFQLDIEKDDLPSSTRIPLINGLLDHLNRRNRIPELLEKVRELRPEQDWPRLPGERIDWTLSVLKSRVGA